MAFPSDRCPVCARPCAPGQAFCGFCGARLGAPGPYPVPSSGTAWAGASSATPGSPTQTITGLMLMIVAFALSWIPIADVVGGILTLIGLVYLWNGRRELGAAHRGEVKLGVLLFVMALVVGVAGAVALVVATISFNFSVANNGTAPTLAHTAPSLGLEVAVGALVTVAAALIAACWVKLPYSLADPSARRLLLVAGALEVIVTAVYAAAEIHAFATLASVYSLGGSSGPWPDPTLVGLLLVAPYLLFLVAYRRIRKRLIAGDPSMAAVGAFSAP